MNRLLYSFFGGTSLDPKRWLRYSFIQGDFLMYFIVLLIADISVAAGWDWCCAAGESPDGGNVL